MASEHVSRIADIQLLTRIGEMEERCMMEKNELVRALQAVQERLAGVFSEQVSESSDTPYLVVGHEGHDSA